MLAHRQVHALDKSRIDLPTAGCQHLLDRLQRPEHDATAEPHQAPSPYGLDHLRVEQTRQGHPARLGHGAFAWASWGLHPLGIKLTRSGYDDRLFMYHRDIPSM